MSSKVDTVIKEYLEAAGINLEGIELTPDEDEAVQNVKNNGAQTDGGKKVVKAINRKRDKQDKNAKTAAQKIEQS
jgi:hypothetical protein